jgi:ornithine carbamoyltransferase
MKFDSIHLKKLKGRSLISLYDLSERELLELIHLAEVLKARRRKGIRGNLLQRKNVALIFEKMSTRTRCAAAVALSDEGAIPHYLPSHELHWGKKESIKDSARVLGRLFDGIFFRGYSQQTVQLLAEYSGVPVWNGLTDEAHPTQTLADLMTIKEEFGELKGLKVVYLGDGRNNVATSLMAGCAMCGINFVNCTPKALTPSDEFVKRASEVAKRNGGSVEVTTDPRKAVKGANVIYTDVWVSMGEESKREQRMRLLRAYQVDMKLIKLTGNLENGRVIFLHCLPALHDNNTEMTVRTGAQEVTDEVFEADFSRVFENAENRLHTLKALFIATLK